MILSEISKNSFNEDNGKMHLISLTSIKSDRISKFFRKPVRSNTDVKFVHIYYFKNHVKLRNYRCLQFPLKELHDHFFGSVIIERDYLI